jgi:hypothetical protein
LVHGGDAVSSATRATSWWRLGQAAVESQAWRDAAEAFEQVAALDTGARGREALTMLGETYAQLRDVAGQYRTTLKVAALTTGAEAEALLRRAVWLYEGEPHLAWDALAVLLQAHASEQALYEKGAQALASLGRLGELVAVHERYATAVGGPAAGAALMAAATLAELELHDPARAFELRVEATRVDPDNLEAAEAVLAEARRRNDGVLIEAQLRRLAVSADETRASELLLELAASLEARADHVGARQALAPVLQRGAAGAGYAQALNVLERVARALNEPAALATVQLASAELLPTAERATRLLDAARTWQQAGQFEQALEVARQSLAAHGTRAGYELLVELARASGNAAELARALTDLGGQLEGLERGALWLQAVEAWHAAGDDAKAREALERVLREAPAALTLDEAATRFLSLGAPERALELAWEPALAGGRAGRALELADLAGDAQKAATALAVLAAEHPESAEGVRFVAMLRAAADLDGMAAFAATAAPKSREVAVGLWRELAVAHGRVDAAQALFQAGELGSIAATATAPEVLGVLAAHAGDLDEGPREQVLLRVAELLPARRLGLQRQLATLYATQRRFAEAVAVLAALANDEEHPAGRAALHVELGELLLHEVLDPVAATAAFERALLDDPNQLGAVRPLVALYRGVVPERFVVMVERLRTLAGDQGVADLREALADAYEGLGRTREAYQLLAQLDETPERVRRRAALAEALGLGGEALALREKVATERAEFEQLLTGYLQADLVPFAVRLAERLLGEGPLSPETTRLLAERLAGTTQGAALAVRVWPALLATQVTDVDGWTLFAEALRRLGREADAALADGFGAALTSTRGPAPSAVVATLRDVVPSTASVPPEVVEIDDRSMPRLSAALHDALLALGVDGVQPVLDPAGGVEVWLAGTRLVVGAGALAVFGQAELPFLVALGLELGESGAALRAEGKPAGFDDAVRAAFAVYPASLAACRVVAHLDPEVRGADHRALDLGAVLRASETFKALGLACLQQLGWVA